MMNKSNFFRNQEFQETSNPGLESAVRVTKTSEDRYIRSNSSSSRSSVDENIASPRSNVYQSSTITGKPDFNRVFILEILLLLF